MVLKYLQPKSNKKTALNNEDENVKIVRKSRKLYASSPKNRNSKDMEHIMVDYNNNYDAFNDYAEDKKQGNRI